MSLLPLSSIDFDAARWGGKAAGAARIRSLNLLVPDSLVIGAEYFQRHLQDVGYVFDRWPMPESQIRYLCDQIWRCIENAPLDDIYDVPVETEHLLDKILAANTVVRSSSTLEDGAESSFAGCYETHFSVTDRKNLIGLIRRCWKSAYTPSVASYAISRGLPADMGFAVLIQEQIQCEVAGVCFSLDPVTGREDQWLIEANWGNALSVVSGNRPVDRYHMEKRSMRVHQKLAVKTAYISFGIDGVLEIPTDDDIADMACLEPAQIEAVGTAAAKLQDIFACHVDIEWGFRDNRLYIFQCRPVTTRRTL